MRAAETHHDPTPEGKQDTMLNSDPRKTKTPCKRPTTPCHSEPQRRIRWPVQGVGDEYEASLPATPTLYAINLILRKLRMTLWVVGSGPPIKDSIPPGGRT